MAHTKGPWASYENSITAKARKIEIAQIFDMEEIPASEIRDNKKLIKAAPDMYHALHRIIDAVSPFLPETVLSDITSIAKAGLRKAPKRK